MAVTGQLTEVHPGVWRIRLGEPEPITPTGLFPRTPAAEGLEQLSRVSECPVRVESVGGEVTPRGYLLSMPLVENEQVYGLGLQLHSFNQRGKKKTLRVNSDPVADTVVNPRDEVAFLRIANMPRRGIGDATLHQVHALCLAENIPFAKGLSEAMRRGVIQGRSEAGIRELLGLLRGFGERFRQGGGPLSQLVQELVDRIGYRAELVRTSKSDLQLEQKWSNVEAVIDAVAQYEQQCEGPPTLSAFLDESALNKNDDQRGNANQKRSGVTLNSGCVRAP